VWRPAVLVGLIINVGSSWALFSSPWHGDLQQKVDVASMEYRQVMRNTAKIPAFYNVEAVGYDRGKSGRSRVCSSRDLLRSANYRVHRVNASDWGRTRSSRGRVHV
jgi:hypothetical protein